MQNACDYKEVDHKWVSLGLGMGSYCWMCYHKQVAMELMLTEREKVQNLIIGVFYLQRANLQRVLERGV